VFYTLVLNDHFIIVFSKKLTFIYFDSATGFFGGINANYGSNLIRREGNDFF